MFSPRDSESESMWNVENQSVLKTAKNTLSEVQFSVLEITGEMRHASTRHTDKYRQTDSETLWFNTME